MNQASQLNTLLTYYDISTSAIGSASWWEEVNQIGMPCIKNQEDEDCLVLFIWRDPQGDEEHSETNDVILHVSGLTNHNTWDPTCLKRLNGSDVWFASLIVDAQWRGSYSYLPINVNQSPRLVKKVKGETKSAQRAWWLEIVKNQIPDYLNAYPMIVSGWGMSSPLHLPNAPKELGWNEWDQGKLKQLPVNESRYLDWYSEQLQIQRKCTLFSTANTDAPLVILLDGEKWEAKTGTLSVLQHLTNTNEISPAHYLLIPSINAATRWQELSCYRPFWNAVIDELLPQVKAYLIQSEILIDDYIIAGQSLGGLSALYAGAEFPDYFSKVITLSGSFWWPEIQRMQDADTFKLANPDWQTIPPKNSLADLALNNLINVAHLSIYQTVGIAEQDLCVYNDIHQKALEQKGATIFYDKVNGGHDWLSWRSALINGLIKLIPPKLASR